MTQKLAEPICNSKPCTRARPHASKDWHTWADIGACERYQTRTANNTETTTNKHKHKQARKQQASKHANKQANKQTEIQTRKHADTQTHRHTAKQRRGEEISADPGPGVWESLFLLFMIHNLVTHIIHIHIFLYGIHVGRQRAAFCTFVPPALLRFTY